MTTTRTGPKRLRLSRKAGIEWRTYSNILEDSIETVLVMVSCLAIVYGEGAVHEYCTPDARHARSPLKIDADFG